MKALTRPHVACLRGCLVAILWLACVSVYAQRIQFPTQVSQPMSPPPTTFAPAAQPPAGSFAPPPGGYAPPGGSFNYNPAPATTTVAPPPTFDPYAAPLSQPSGGYAPPYQGAAPYSPYSPSPYSPPPAYGGTASPYASNPYSPYGTTNTQPLYPDGFGTAQPYPADGFWAQPTRFLQALRLRNSWLAPGGSNSLGVNDIETSATFAVPLFQWRTPFLFTPGFAMHFFDGPVTEAPAFADFPPRTYDAYLDTAWHPQPSPWFGANLGVRVGAYTDFNTFNTNSIRVMGRGLGIITLTPTVQIALGAVYIDRVKVKMLPAGGIIWVPNPDTHLDILFPNPKLAQRWTTLGTSDVWFYLSGEYGGGSWTIQRIGMTDQADYNDVRANVGIEAFRHNGLHAFFEVGYVFHREIVYRSATPSYNASDTVMLRAGLSY